MSELTLKLIILLIPGGIGAIILERITVHKPWTSFKFIANSIIIGVFSYLLLQIIYSAGYYVWHIKDNFIFNNSQLTVWNSISETNNTPYL